MEMPNEFSQYQLNKVGISIKSIKPITLRCDRCTKVWSVGGKGLRLPKGYWKCPNGCNTAKDA